ncbi:hypothetical protein pb186bvf_003266 [Paramecium bursaria]
MGNNQFKTESNDKIEIQNITIQELSSRISKSYIELHQQTMQKLEQFSKMAQEFMKNSTKMLQKKRAVIILGKTGTCKSTIIELLSYNNNLYVVEVDGIYQVHGSERIGNLSISHTKFLYEQEIYQDIYLIDTPGIDDTRGQLQDIENSLHIQQAINTSENVKILYCIPFDETKSRQNELKRVVDDLIRLTLANQSIGIIITKVPTKLPLIEENEKTSRNIKIRTKSMIEQMDLEEDVKDIILDIFQNNITLFNDPQNLDAPRIFQNNREEINNLINRLIYTRDIQNKNYLLLSSKTKQYYNQLLDSMIKQIKEILQEISNMLIRYIIQISDQKFISNKSKSILEYFAEVIPDRVKIKDLCSVILDINQLFQRHNINIKLQDQQSELLSFYSFIVGQILVDYIEIQKSINLFPLKAEIFKAIRKCQKVIDQMERDNIILIEEENRKITAKRRRLNRYVAATIILPYSVCGVALGPIGLLVGFTFGAGLACTIIYLSNQNEQRQNN